MVIHQADRLRERIAYGGTSKTEAGPAQRLAHAVRSHSAGGNRLALCSDQAQEFIAFKCDYPTDPLGADAGTKVDEQDDPPSDEAPP